MGPHSQAITYDKCVLVTNDKLFHFLSEFVRLSGATQSSNYLRQTCTGNKCTPDKAIDGNWKTWSGTKNTNLEWWAAEMEEAVRIDKIFVYSSEYSFKYKFKRFKVRFLFSFAILVICHDFRLCCPVVLLFLMQKNRKIHSLRIEP